MGGLMISEPSQPFLAQMSRLLGLRFAPADMTTHWEALQDVPLDVLSAAVTRAQRTRSEFPTPAELREDCDAVAHLVRGDRLEEEDRGVDLEAPVELGEYHGHRIAATRIWNYVCDDCSDTGWRNLDRQSVSRCACWEINPVLIRKRDQQRQYAERRGK